jgi:pSer/pThr/pTyr-binding forkhead associated (FHA) protein
MSTIRIITPENSELLYPISRGVTSIGSDEGNSIVLNHSSISPRHIRIIWNGSQFFVENISPDRSTSVNGAKIYELQPLVDGAVIAFGDLIAVFSPNDIGAPQESTAEARRKSKKNRKRPQAEPKYKDVRLQEKEIRSLCNSSFACAVCGLFCLGIILTPFALYYSNRAKTAISVSSLNEDKKTEFLGRAKTARVISWIALAITLFGLILSLAGPQLGGG